ncbi:hypothetical protein [Rhodoferax sp.]|uniref:hypothetical protein n=1 Tax=Rhodoferax sp. TaxID=50421 RepID=UPI0025EFECD2|nr:hypothetical protein [Rhodoferax sp.]
MEHINHRPAIVQPNSPLRRIPASFNVRQRAYFDGIVYSIEIADMAYRRLRETLWSISKRIDEDDDIQEYVHAVADAWLVIDSLNRLRALCISAPLIAGNEYCRGFVQSLYPVKGMRNNVQHLDGRIDNMVRTKQPVWGSLSWAVVTDHPPTKARLHTLVAGSFRPGEHEMVDIGGRSFLMPVDAITLTAGGESLELSGLMVSTADFTALAEADLSQLIEPGEPYTRDLHLMTEVTFNDSEVPSGKLKITFS